MKSIEQRWIRFWHFKLWKRRFVSSDYSDEIHDLSKPKSWDCLRHSKRKNLTYFKENELGKELLSHDGCYHCLRQFDNDKNKKYGK